jgi:PAS domain S-box-containing protein
MKAGVIRLFLAPLAAVAIAAVFQALWATSLLSDSVPLLPFFIAVVLSGFLGGIRAGLLATAASAIVVWRVTLVAIPSPHQLPIFAFLLVGGTIISVILEALHRSRRRASAAISQLEEIQRRLRDSEQTFRNLADAIPVLIRVADRAGNGSWFNRGWLEFTGRPLEQELGNGWLHNVHPDDRERCLKIFTSHVAGDASVEMDYRLRRRDGHYRWILDCSRPDFNDGGTFRGYIGGGIDIHDRKETQARIERDLPAERRAREEAERVSRLKDEFIATVSHELRTPLTAILGWVHLLRQDPANVEPGPALETIERNARAQVRLIEDLLDVNRILSGRLRLELQCIALVEVIEAALAAIEPTARSRGIRLRRAFDTPISHVHGDAVRLRQIIWNLLSNAVKFSPASNEVTVTLSRVGPNLEVGVRDSGEGIDPDFLPHVFERFRPADGTLTRRQAGMGLGLSIVKQLTELHGGSIRVESPGIGLGATFVLSLPAATPGTPPPSTAPPPFS